MRARLLGGHRFQIERGEFTERPAGSGKKQTDNSAFLRIAGVVLRQRLENRVVLAVDRQERRSVRFDCVHEN